MLGNLKIFTIALLMRSVMGRRFNVIQYEALFLLVAGDRRARHAPACVALCACMLALSARVLDAWRLQHSVIAS